ncbi:Alanine racemase-like [gamma proteobacterium HdN1]|nr:Alanine racemase-like [gamma proteobacterium HdN1]
MNRRTFLLGGVAAAVVGGITLRPSDIGAPYEPYFESLNGQLKQWKIGRPLLLIDAARMQQNTEKLMAHLRTIGRHYRIVAKSLPSLGLVQQIMEWTGSKRIMTFQQPFMNDLAAAEPDVDLLLGKPMPIDAAERFYAKLEGAFNPDLQLQWLIDTPARLEEYLQLAKRLERSMRISIEIDVGLHRGGMTDPSQLDELLTTILANPSHLQFAGFMGYDGHVGKLPSILESTEKSLANSIAEYRRYVDYLKAKWPTIAARTDLTFNGAGSPTVMLHGTDTPLTELSAGSCLVKPTDFDTPALASFEPAAFIATPVLKQWTGLKLPGPLPLGALWQKWDVNRSQTYFIYGGYWKAKPVSPRGIRENALYGFSSNQMMYNGSATTGLRVGDYLFFRPTQSEAVLLQFGNLLAFQGDQQLAWWAPFSQVFDH